MTNELKLEKFEGTHYEMGVQQGTVYKQKLQGMWNIFSNMELVKRLKPKIIPKNLFFRTAKKRATEIYKKIIEKYAPKQAERIRGISEGSGMDLKTLYLFQAAETMLSGEATHVIPTGGCTSLGISSKKSSTGDCLISRNFDLYSILIPAYVGRRSRPIEGFSNIDFGLCVYAGNFHGMNEKGLTITYNYADPTDGLKPGVPISILIQEALEKYETTEETVEFFQKSLRSNGALLLIGDSSGDIEALEISCHRTGVRLLEDSFIVNTNHFHSEQMKPIDIPVDAVFSDKCLDKSLVGKRIRESTEKRYERANMLLSKARTVDEKTLESIMRDHGPERKPSRTTICVHTPYVSTTMSVIFNLNKRTMDALIGNPCQSRYKRFKI